MPIVLARIDDRLVHGQIVQGWLKAVDVHKIVVASDAVAADSMQQMLMAIAVPSSADLEIKTVKDATEALLRGDYDKAETMILAASPADILYMLEQGAKIDSVNVGGMHFVHGKRQLLRNLSVNDEDVVYLHKICERGVELEGRVLPYDERVNLAPVIEREYAESGLKR